MTHHTFVHMTFDDVEPTLDLLRECLLELVDDAQADVSAVGDLLRDDDIYFWAADALVEPGLEAGWHALARRLDGLPGFRAAVLELGSGADFRCGAEVIFLGEMALEDAAAA